MKKLWILGVLSMIFSTGSIGQSSFSITTTGTNPTIDSAINYATFTWSQYLNSAVPIKINVVYTNLTGGGPLAVTFPNGRKDFLGAPEAAVWYATSLANSIAGTELNPGEFDMDIYVNSSVNYYFGLDGIPGSNQYDFISVFLHEISHGLGTGSISKIDAGVGSFGMLDSSSTAPFVASFPFPELEGLPSIWDIHLVNGIGEQITDTLLYPNISTALGNQFESNDLFFSGTNATTANGGSQPKIFAPSTYESGSSLQHFNESTFPNSSGNSLLTPYFYNNEVEHNPGELLVGALQDIGWDINGVGIIEESTLSYQIYPNPSNGFFTVSTDQEIYAIDFFNLTGEVIANYTNIQKQHSFNLTEFPNGIYLYRISAGDFTSQGKIIIR
jgi:hypothetical protein